METPSSDSQLRRQFSFLPLVSYSFITCLFVSFLQPAPQLSLLIDKHTTTLQTHSVKAVYVYNLGIPAPAINKPFTLTRTHRAVKTHFALRQTLPISMKNSEKSRLFLIITSYNTYILPKIICP